MADVRKPDLVLSDGKEIFFDLDKITYREARGVFDPEEDSARTDETIGKCAGMTLEEVYKISAKDYKRLGKAFVGFWINWQDDPKG